MPRQSKETKRRIIDAAYGLLYKEGFARVSVDAIAEAAGVTKRTLYYHFDSKDALVAAVLDIQHELMFTRIQSWGKGVSGDPATMIEKLFTELAAWSRQPGWRGSGFTRAAMEFAHSPDHPARLAARRHKAAVEGWLGEQFAQNGFTAPQELARQLMLLIEGCHSLTLIHGDASYADAASEAARLLVDRRGSRRSTKARAPVNNRRPGQ
jgi:AcrR family transcriptional regulator